MKSLYGFVLIFAFFGDGQTKKEYKDTREFNPTPEELVQLAEMAVEFERYGELKEYMTEALDEHVGKPITQQDLQLVHWIFKGPLTIRRNSYWDIDIEKEKNFQKWNEDQKAMAVDFMEKDKKEIRDLCNQALRMVDPLVARLKEDAHAAQVFAFIFRADFYRYKMVYTTGWDRDFYERVTGAVYEKAYDLGKQHLTVLHSTTILAANKWVSFYNDEGNCKASNELLDKMMQETEAEKTARGLTDLDDELQCSLQILRLNKYILNYNEKVVAHKSN